MKYSICDKCQKTISNNNLQKHYNSCAPKKKKIRGIDFDPNWGYITGTRTAWNKGLSKENNDIVRMHAEKLKEKYKNGLLKPSGVAVFTYQQRREHAKKNNFGGYRENAGHSKKYKMLDSFGKEVCLQSSYEKKCADILNDLKIRWIRPKYLKYENKKYFPDFYLIDYNIYLDPKNDYLSKIDDLKIKKVMQENNVIIHILKNNMINKETILCLCS